MPARLSQSEVEAILQKAGVRLHSNQKYVNRKTKLKLICKHGHIFERTLDHYQLGHTCPECRGFTVTPTENDPIITISEVSLARSQWLARIDQYSEYDSKGCLIWKGRTNDKGYGVIQVGGRENPKKLYVHRIRKAIQLGEDIPKGYLVTHRCDVPSCNRTSHLWLGTPRSNILEAVERDRMNYSVGDPKLRGSLRYNARLDEPSVVFIKRLLSVGVKHKIIADHCFVSESAIGSIASGETWGWLDPW